MRRHSNTQSTAKEEYYTWDSENRLKEMVLNGRSMKYLYDESGTRTAKRGMRGETLYPNQYYQLQNQDEFVKHVFVGSTRISSALGSAEYYDYMYESSSIYYYHPDHLGSTTYVTDAYGEEFEHMEYTPYGELWIDEGSNKHLISYRFTGKELDEETGLYYYGARYLDPMTSRWISSDPSGSELMNPMDGEGKAKQNYSTIEGMNWFSYVSNNPLKYVDPNGYEEVYFLMAFNPDLRDRDTNIINKLLPGITEIIKDLNSQGVDVAENYAAEEADMIAAFNDDEAVAIIILGHGNARKGGIKTFDDKRLSPDDIEGVGSNLSFVVLEACQTHFFKDGWEEATGAVIYTNSEIVTGSEDRVHPDLVGSDYSTGVITDGELANFNERFLAPISHTQVVRASKQSKTGPSLPTAFLKHMIGSKNHYFFNHHSNY